RISWRRFLAWTRAAPRVGLRIGIVHEVVDRAAVEELDLDAHDARRIEAGHLAREREARPVPLLRQEGRGVERALRRRAERPGPAGRDAVDARAVRVVEQGHARAVLRLRIDVREVERERLHEAREVEGDLAAVGIVARTVEDAGRALRRR